MAIAGAGQSSILISLVNGKVHCGPRMHRHRDLLVDPDEAIANLEKGNYAALRLYGNNLKIVMDHFGREERKRMMSPLGFGGRQSNEWVKQIARGEPFEGGAAIRALATEVVHLEELLRRVHPGLFTDDNLLETELEAGNKPNTIE